MEIKKFNASALRLVAKSLFTFIRNVNKKMLKIN